MIQIEHLTKLFGQRRVVDDVTLTVERGEVLGFLGPNGAGKSTTMRMVTGFLPATSGRVAIGGHDVMTAPLAAKRLIGYLPESAASYPDMTVHGFLTFVAELRGMSGDAKKRAVHRVVERCFLGSVLYQQIDTLSKGYRHRTCLAQALIHDPDVLIMDEPTDGLDPNQKHEVRNLIREMGKTKAVIFSTHILEEVDAACTRAIIIDRGRIVANGTPESLKAMATSAGSVRLVVEGVDGAAVRDACAAVAEASGARIDAAQAGASSADAPSAIVHVAPKDKTAGAALARALMQLAERQRWQVAELRVEAGQLDEVFRNLTLSDTARA